MTKEEKIKAIAGIDAMQKQLAAKANKIAKRPKAKTISTSRKRATEVVKLVAEAHRLHIEKLKIAATPTPNYIKGGVVRGGIAIIGEVGPEITIPA